MVLSKRPRVIVCAEFWSFFRVEIGLWQRDSKWDKEKYFPGLKIYSFRKIPHDDLRLWEIQGEIEYFRISLERSLMPS
ncbi:CLUMA_CG011426, isoform A [Clunio marinus]|uniref:CLUMA_CG011426, isoform A n=1 Tax=Clunio marinus TaxID=568069 RepID=A0A1J1IHX5_9DIPT|nr:CLUMA_CG011426, isoform A [Clunio marinus]